MDEKESATGYAHALREACVKAHPELDSDLREKMCLAKFVNGLPGADMRRLVRMIAPHSMKQAVALVDSYRSGEPVAEKARKPVPVSVLKSGDTTVETEKAVADSAPWKAILEKLDQLLAGAGKPARQVKWEVGCSLGRMCALQVDGSQIGAVPRSRVF